MPIFISLSCAITASAVAVWKWPDARPFALLAIIVLTPYLAFKIAQFYAYRDAIPEQIGITLPVALAEEGGFTEGCGIAVYRLSDATLEQIAAQGLRFFEGVDQARGHDDAYHHYEPWRETPVPMEWIGDGSIFMCHPIGDALHAELHAAAQQPGAYYTSKPEGRLLVLPAAGLVVFAFDG